MIKKKKNLPPPNKTRLLCVMPKFVFVCVSLLCIAYKSHAAKQQFSQKLKDTSDKKKYCIMLGVSYLTQIYLLARGEKPKSRCCGTAHFFHKWIKGFMFFWLFCPSGWLVLLGFCLCFLKIMSSRVPSQKFKAIITLIVVCTYPRFYSNCTIIYCYGNFWLCCIPLSCRTLRWTTATTAS